jgi:hypothetical protein
VANKLLLSARRGTDLASDLKDLDEENLLTVGWTVGWPRGVDIMGGNPLLLTERRVVAPNWCASYFCHRNPRTGIGITGRGKVLLVTVDGRQPRRSVGMTLAGFARVFKNLGATDAINLDGGGSTTMVIRGRVVNRPSDHQGERRVGSVILVRGYTPPPLRTTPTPHVASGTQTREAPDSLEFDPGSTGGMLDAFARGALGPRHPAIPRAVQPLLRAYRSRSSTR